MAGFALWCFNDYATLRKKRYRGYSGVVDAWRLPKPPAALVAALCRPEPVLGLWADWGEEGGPGARAVHVFTNCREVRLAAGGREVAVLRDPAPYAAAAVPFEPAALAAVGVGAGGEVRERLEPWGPAVRLAARAEAVATRDTERPIVAVRVQGGGCARPARARMERRGTGAGERPGGAAGVPPRRAVKVARGEGRAFVVTAAAGTVTVDLSASGLDPCRCTVSAG